jgi:dCTP deaminase
MIKPDHWIQRWGEEGGVVPYEFSQINAASYDVRVGSDWIFPSRKRKEVKSDSVHLDSGEVVLATTLETVVIPRDVACDLKLKSTFGRLWINHSLAGWCDPGFRGQITLELQNIGPETFELKAGTRIAQLIFMGLESPPIIAYGDPGSSAHYQGQLGTTRAYTEEKRRR